MLAFNSFLVASLTAARTGPEQRLLFFQFFPSCLSRFAAVMLALAVFSFNSFLVASTSATRPLQRHPGELSILS